MKGGGRKDGAHDGSRPSEGVSPPVRGRDGSGVPGKSPGAGRLPDATAFPRKLRQAKPGGDTLTFSPHCAGA